MLEKCKFDPSKDRGIVIKGLGVDVNNLLVNHKVDNSMADIVYNQFSEIEEIGCHVNDDFDLYKYYKNFTNTLKLNANGGTGSSQGPAPVSET